MTILIDAPRWPFGGRLWSHMISDISIADLHRFARANLVRYMSFGLDHYDIPDSMLEAMVSAGAIPADSRELVARLRHAGLRRPEGKDARTWRPASILNADGGSDVDPELLIEANHALRGERPTGSLDEMARCFARPNTTVAVVEGTRDPGRDWPEQSVVSRYGNTWALEFVIGEF